MGHMRCLTSSRRLGVCFSLGRQAAHSPKPPAWSQPALLTLSSPHAALTPLVLAKASCTLTTVVEIPLVVVLMIFRERNEIREKKKTPAFFFFSPTSSLLTTTCSHQLFADEPFPLPASCSCPFLSTVGTSLHRAASRSVFFVGVFLLEGVSAVPGEPPGVQPSSAGSSGAELGGRVTCLEHQDQTDRLRAVTAATTAPHVYTPKPTNVAAAFCIFVGRAPPIRIAWAPFFCSFSLPWRAVRSLSCGFVVASSSGSPAASPSLLSAVECRFVNSWRVRTRVYVHNRMFFFGGSKNFRCKEETRCRGALARHALGTSIAKMLGCRRRIWEVRRFRLQIRIPLV